MSLIDRKYGYIPLGRTTCSFCFYFLEIKNSFGHWGRNKTQESSICLDYFSEHSITQEKDKFLKFSSLPIRLFKPGIFRLSGKQKYLARNFKVGRGLIQGIRYLLNNWKGWRGKTQGKPWPARKFTSRSQQQEITAARGNQQWSQLAVAPGPVIHREKRRPPKGLPSANATLLTAARGVMVSTYFMHSESCASASD